MKEVSLVWSEFKIQVVSRMMNAQWVDLGDYSLIAFDGQLMFTCTLVKGTSDAIDFETNYKDIWNQPQVIKSSESGLERFYSSPRPQGTSTYFCGQGDDVATPAIGSGQEIFVDMTTGDSVKTIYLDFTEEIYPKDGIVFFKGAPMGAKVDVYINHPLAGNVGYFVRSLRIYGDNNIGVALNSEDVGLMPQGIQLAIRVYNGDTPANFQVWGLFEIYRQTIV